MSMSWNAVAAWALLSASAAAEPAQVVVAPPAAEESPPRNVVWIEPLAGGPGRASVGFERALGRYASLWVDALGGVQTGHVVDPSFGAEISQQAGVGMGGLGLRVFPLGAAPFGLWVGLETHGGFGSTWLDVRSTTSDETLMHVNQTVFVGEAGVQAGYSIAVWKGFALQGSVGAGANYLGYLEGAGGGMLTFGLTTWLGVGYAF